VNEESVYGILTDDGFSAAPGIVAILANTDEHKDDLIYIPGRYNRKLERVGAMAKVMIEGTVFSSGRGDIPAGSSVYYYEAAGSMDLSTFDAPWIPAGKELRCFGITDRINDTMLLKD
jgi:hypothetical protein